MLRSILGGVVAGAAGELALEAVSYTDMFARARPASEMPGKVAERLADAAGVELAKPGERAEKAAVRREAGGAILGYGMAVGVAVSYALLRHAGLRLPLPLAGLAMGGAAMAISNSTATALGVTDPREWGTEGWLADIVPHAAYGLAAASTLEMIDP